MKLSTMASNLIGSEIIKIAGEVNEMIKKGDEICNLTIGDFDPSYYPIPKELENEIIAAYAEKLTNYPPANGVSELRESVSDFIKARLGLNYSPNDILIAGGSRPLIYVAYLAILDQFDTVVFPVPSWNNNHYCHLSGATPIMIETTEETNFLPLASQLAPHLKNATLLALNSPLNPTGTAFSKKNLEEICDLVIQENETRLDGEKPLYMLFDQMYWMLTFGETKHYDPVSLRPELKNYVIYIDGISKSFAATGVRVGWAFGPEAVINKMKSILGHVGAWSPKPEQMATARFLRNGKAVDRFVFLFKEKMQKSLEALYEGFIGLKKDGFDVDAISPMGAIYLTASINIAGKTTPDGKILINSKDVTSYILTEAKVAVVPFTAFGASENSSWFRLSAGGCHYEDIVAAIPRLRKALSKLS